jgi:hypothetical protein
VIFIPQSINVVRAASNEPAIAPYWAIVDKTPGVKPSDIPKYLKNGQNPSCPNFLFFFD